MINVLGVDPSLSNFGLVEATIDIETLDIVITSMRLVETENEKGKQVRQSSDDLRRAILIHKAFSKAYVGKIFVISEIPSGSQSSRGSLSNGACLMAIAGSPVPVIQVTPNEVKMVSVGKRNASKAEMIEWATSKYPRLDWFTHKSKGKIICGNKNEHLADAIATIHAGVKTDQFLLAVSVMKSMWGSQAA